MKITFLETIKKITKLNFNSFTTIEKTKQIEQCILPITYH